MSNVQHDSESSVDSAEHNRFQLAVYHAAHKGALHGAVEGVLYLGAAAYLIYAAAELVRHFIAARKGS